MTQRYSREELPRYYIPGVEQCEFRAISRMVSSQVIWNLYWLSNPKVDSLVGSTSSGWWRRYEPWPNLAGAVIRDALFDERMKFMLGKPAAAFHAWFCAERDYTIYDCWDVMGPQWVENVVSRSNEAAVRGLAAKPFIQSDGKVLRIDMMKVT